MVRSTAKKAASTWAGRKPTADCPRPPTQRVTRARWPTCETWAAEHLGDQAALKAFRRPFPSVQGDDGSSAVGLEADGSGWRLGDPARLERELQAEVFTFTIRRLPVHERRDICRIDHRGEVAQGSLVQLVTGRAHRRALSAPRAHRFVARSTRGLPAPFAQRFVAHQFTGPWSPPGTSVSTGALRPAAFAASASATWRMVTLWKVTAAATRSAQN